MIHKSEEKLTASPYRSQNPITLALRESHASPQTRPDPNPSAFESWAFRCVMWAPRLITDGNYDPRIRYLSDVSCPLGESKRHLFLDPFHTRGLDAFGSCYLVRHVMKRPWQLSWIKQALCLFPLHKMRVSDSENSVVALEMSLVCWLEEREGLRWGYCEGGWHVFHPPLYTTHQLHPLSIVDIYLQSGYWFMLEM